MALGENDEINHALNDAKMLIWIAGWSKWQQIK